MQVVGLFIEGSFALGGMSIDAVTQESVADLTTVIAKLANVLEEEVVVRVRKRSGLDAARRVLKDADVIVEYEINVSELDPDAADDVVGTLSDPAAMYNEIVALPDADTSFSGLTGTVPEVTPEIVIYYVPEVTPDEEDGDSIFDGDMIVVIGIAVGGAVAVAAIVAGVWTSQKRKAASVHFRESNQGAAKQTGDQFYNNPSHEKEPCV